MGYERQLEVELRSIKRFQAKQEIALQRGDTDLCKYFEGLEARSWKAVGDLRRLIGLMERRKKRRR